MRKPSKKKEFRTFLGQLDAEWVEFMVGKGDMGNTPSEVIRTIIRDTRTGVLS